MRIIVEIREGCHNVVSKVYVGLGVIVLQGLLNSMMVKNEVDLGREVCRPDFYLLSRSRRKFWRKKKWAAFMDIEKARDKVICQAR